MIPKHRAAGFVRSATRDDDPKSSPAPDKVLASDPDPAPAKPAARKTCKQPKEG